MQELMNRSPSDTSPDRLYHGGAIGSVRRVRHGLAGQHEKVDRAVATEGRQHTGRPRSASDARPEFLDHAHAVEGFAIL